MRHALSRFLIVTAVLVTLLPAGAFASTRYFCRMMDRVMSSACCCVKQRPAPSHAVDEDAIRAADCCERLEPADSTVPSSTRPTPLDNLPYGFAAILPVFELEAPHARSRVVVTPGAARAPPLFGPPLFLKHCVLLT